MRAVLFLLLLVPGFCLPAGATTLRGKVSSQQGEGLPFVSVYIKGTTRGTTTNVDGFYSMELAPGKYEIACRYIGFRLHTEQVELGATPLELNITLAPESVELKEVTISAKSEDPAYAIIRQTIKKRKFYLEQVESFSCDVYIKGLQRIKKFPKKFFGQELNPDMLGIIDTASGIVYLSESVSRFNYLRPDKIREEMISSKVSGNNQAFSYNQASEMLFNFYENLITVDELSDRGFVSPISASALLYYRYRLVGTFRENGVLVNKIEVTPIRKNDPVFRGFIYILEDSWRVHSAELFLTKDANIDFVDTLWIKQVHAPIDKEVWMPISNKFDFDFGFMGLKGNGMFVGVNSNYVLQPDFPKRFFSNEVMKVQDDANKKDSAYWKESRPVPLTREENTDYVKRDSLEVLKNSKPYLDSLDKKTNRFNWSNVLFGYTYNRRFKKDQFFFTGPVQTFQFNTVEGFNISLQGGYFKRYENRRSLTIRPELRYGFANTQLIANVGGSYFFRPQKFGSAHITVGTDNSQYAPKGIPPLVNTFYTLLDNRNLMKLYHREFATASFREELVNGLYLDAGLEYARRSALVNHTSYSLIRNDRRYTSNNPLHEGSDIPAFAPHSSFTASLDFKIVPGQKYYTRPNAKFIMGTKYPSLLIGYRKGIGALGNVDYDMVKAGVEDEMKAGLLGNSRYSVTAGKFLNTKFMYFMDFQHFTGNQTIITDYELKRFNALEYYRYSTNDYFLEAHFEHNFGGFLLNKIPLLRKLKLKEVASVHYLTNDRIRSYTELNIGIQRGIIPFKLQFVTSFADNKRASSGFQLAIPF
jgi:hypothetical protein